MKRLALSLFYILSLTPGAWLSPGAAGAPAHAACPMQACACKLDGAKKGACCCRVLSPKMRLAMAAEERGKAVMAETCSTPDPAGALPAPARPHILPSLAQLYPGATRAESPAPLAPAAFLHSEKLLKVPLA